jgi:hypothetical protein
MPIPEFAPPLTAPEAVVATLRQQGFAVANADCVAKLASEPQAWLAALAAEWEGMPVDPYLKDNGRYRRRRHASFLVDQESCLLVPQRAHFQSPEYNALHGGMTRWFAPMRSELIAQPPWSALLRGLAAVYSQLSPAARWYVEAHQFRIDTSGGIGRPTPEGAHRDGVDFVALILVARQRIRGGETRVFQAHAPHGTRFTLSEPGTMLLLDDARVIHESTPIQPLLEAAGDLPSGFRDTLVLTFRRGGFQEPPEAPAA